ncbi:hypothetical protein Sste5346_008691 [Sporothrix stenoceras]|uniref:Yeast cell wall synthesis Kre9/Knh1-like N-terminal domain-containing protein n=1 Tax=Sporothrix stenoceras TaxID=5173 RepID=A0ABR3YPA9_9PEZI
MKLSSILLTAAAVSVDALTFTNANFYNISIGNPFNITWADASGPVSLTLLKGGTEPFFTNMTTFANNLSGTSYVWTPSADLTSDTYLIHFADTGGGSAYGFYFALVDAPYSLSTTTTESAAAKTTAATTTAAPQSTYTYP